MKHIDCFLLYEDFAATERLVSLLSQHPLINQIYLITHQEQPRPIASARLLKAEQLWNSALMQQIAQLTSASYALIQTRKGTPELGQFALERFIRIADDTQAGLIYADYQIAQEGKTEPHPVIDYQFGSLRDDFDFGPLLLFRKEALHMAARSTTADYQFAALYETRLAVSQQYPIIHINEYLYTIIEHDTRKSGEKIFDYVDPKNRQVQIEMEIVCTEHLKQIGGYLPPHFLPIDLKAGEFEQEASVIIPVRNRVQTIDDAIQSVLKQETTFPFNLIIIDNHSTDGTSERIRSYTHNPKVIHVIPERNDLGIGGCWNTGVQHKACGRFAIQLDSDDVYSDEHTVQKIVTAFYEQQCAMMVGTYMMTNFEMEMIAPGIIDHKEWTPENGRNNALRINGLGAPRAFFTPLLRQLPLPNTSYGEDYAAGLRISRDYQIGRIYDVLYLCRRWKDNSDAALDIWKMNQYNSYKDKLRTWELQARIQMKK